jgi:spore coat protein A, manganese oxidase
MKKKWTYLILTASIVLMLGIGGCSSSSDPPPPAPAAGERAPLNPAVLQQFANPFVEIPIAPTDAAHPATYTVAVRQGTWDFGLRLADGSQIIDSFTGKPIVTKTWGYDVNGVFLGVYGPTVEATRGTTLTFNYSNELRAEVNGARGTGPYLTKHLLPIDPTLDGTNMGEPQCRVAPHLHGGDVDSTSDGHPDAWVANDPAVQALWATPADASTGFPGRPATTSLHPFIYPNTQPAATLWFHDHSMGITRLNAYAGIAAVYLIKDPAVEGVGALANLPKGRYANPVAPTLQSDEFDLPVVIQDKDFTEDGALVFPTFNNLSVYTFNALRDTSGNIVPTVRPEMFGNVIAVNGKAWPFKSVKEQVYRFRIVNGSDSRVYNIWLEDATDGTIITPALASAVAPALTWPVMQIASEQGYADHAVDVATGPAENGLIIAPGQRADILIDFSHPVFRKNGQGRNIIVRNDAPAPFGGLFGPANEDPTTLDPRTTGRVMMFKVSSTAGVASPLFAAAGPATSLRTALVPYGPYPSLTPTRAAGSRYLDLQERKDQVYSFLDPTTGTVSFRTILLLNGLLFHAPITEKPELNGVEEWVMINTTPDVHPMHVHLVKFEVVEKGYVDTSVAGAYARADGAGGMPQINPAALVPSADPRLSLVANSAPANSVYRVAPNELMFWKDTAMVPPAMTPFGANTDVVNPGYIKIRMVFPRTGTYMWHCHILSHEENAMMRPFMVQPVGQGN